LLFEQRVYTLTADSAARFWELQHERGFELVRPIMERLMGYFSARIDGQDAIVHWWRFDSYEDWHQRLHGLYRVEALNPYFKKVRSLLSAQENKFLLHAPVGELNPLWSATSDWLPGDMPLDTGALAGAVCVEMEVIQLRPGSLPAYWQAWKAEGLRAAPLATQRLIGVFHTLVGPLHEVTILRWHGDQVQARRWRDELEGQAGWAAFAAATAPLVASRRSHWLVPAPGKQLSPLF
jgi:hypothetical protein